MLFLKSTLIEFQFEVMTTDAFLFYLDEKLLSKNKAWEQNYQSKEWVYGEGLPENCPKIISTQFELVDGQLKSGKRNCCSKLRR